MVFHRRKSARLKNYDYTLPGGYFVTICTYQRLPFLGSITAYSMFLSEAGNIANVAWEAIGKQFDNLSLDAWVIMPNHVHGLILINCQAKTGLCQFIAWYKYQTTVQINRLWGTQGKPVWQRSFFDHIIRTPEDIAEIREYILGNPAKWSEDEYNRV